MNNFEIKDSGARANIGEGVRDVENGKLDYTLVLDGVMYERWAAHLTKGAKKYAARNWLKFFGTRESALAAYERAGRSLMRHQKDYMAGLLDEDHAAAMVFNINVRETALSRYPDLLSKPSEQNSFLAKLQASGIRGNLVCEEKEKLRLFYIGGRPFRRSGETRIPAIGEAHLDQLGCPHFADSAGPLYPRQILVPVPQ